MGGRRWVEENWRENMGGRTWVGESGREKINGREKMRKEGKRTMVEVCGGSGFKRWKRKEKGVVERASSERLWGGGPNDCGGVVCTRGGGAIWI